MQLQANARLSRGFTLTELMVVVVIVSILLAVAVPSYSVFVRQSRRTDARTAILDLAAREERYYSTNASSYTAVAANLGYAALPAVVGNGYYTVSVCSPACAPSAVAAPSFTIIALPVAGQSQAKDTLCTAFAVDSTGAQFASAGAGYTAAAAAYCWAN